MNRPRSGHYRFLFRSVRLGFLRKPGRLNEFIFVFANLNGTAVCLTHRKLSYIHAYELGQSIVVKSPLPPVQFLPNADRKALTYHTPKLKIEPEPITNILIIRSLLNAKSIANNP